METILVQKKYIKRIMKKDTNTQNMRKKATEKSKMAR